MIKQTQKKDTRRTTSDNITSTKTKTTRHKQIDATQTPTITEEREINGGRKLKGTIIKHKATKEIWKQKVSTYNPFAI